MTPLRQIWMRIAGSRLFVLPADAGRGPDWAIWLATLCGALAVIAWIAAVMDFAHGRSPRGSLVILFGALGLVAGPLWLLRLRTQAVCVALIGIGAVPVLLLSA